MDIDQKVERSRAEFGDEITNTGWAAKTPKRQLDGIAEDEEEFAETPLKKQKLSTKTVLMHTSDSEDEKWVLSALTKKGNRLGDTPLAA